MPSFNGITMSFPASAYGFRKCKGESPLGRCHLVCYHFTSAKSRLLMMISRRVHSMMSTISVSGSGSVSTAFAPPLHTTPSLPDLHTFSDFSSHRVVRCSIRTTRVLRTMEMEPCPISYTSIPAIHVSLHPVEAVPNTPHAHL